MGEIFNPDNKPLYDFTDFDIGQAFMNGYNQQFCIKVSRTMYFNFDTNSLCRLPPDMMKVHNKMYFKCDYEVW